MTAGGVSIPVEVVCLAGAVPFIANGTIHSFHDGTYAIGLDRDASALAPGSVTILNFHDGTTPRVVATVTEVRGNQLACHQQQVHERERRAFPRLHGGVPLRFRVLSPTEEAVEGPAWLAGEPGPAARGTWLSPEEFVNFSVTGLRFDALDILAGGELLLLELGVRGRPGRWRCTARVVRSWPIADEDRTSNGLTHHVAINFEVIPDAAQEALSELTIDIQDTLL